MAFYADQVDTTEAWGRLVDVLQEEAPITRAALQPGARPEEIAVAEQGTGVTWPDSYREWFTCVNGSTQTPQTWGQSGWLLPGFDVLSLDDAVSQHATSLDAWERPDDADLADFYATPPIDAEVIANTFLPPFLPFAGRNGYLLFCDARPGVANGCITEFAAENADTWGTLYPDFPAFLEALTLAIVGRSPFLHHRPVITAGRLDWEIDDDTAPVHEAEPLQTELLAGPTAQNSYGPHEANGTYLTVTLGLPRDTEE